MSDAEHEYQRLEGEADATRARLTETLDALDERRNQAEAVVVLPVKRHPVVGAAVVGALLAAIGLITGLTSRRRARRRARLPARLQRAWREIRAA